MAEEDKQSQGKGKAARKGKNAPRPMRTTLTALGAGMGWAALHMPDIHGLNPDLVTWIVDALIASLVVKAALELATSLLGWCVRAIGGLFSAA